MKDDKRVVQCLNTQLENELTTINQYLLHAHMYDHWGLKRIGDHEHKESIGEMKHADRLTERILMLDGLPNLQDLGKIFIGQGTKEIIEYDLKLGCATRGAVIEGIAYCESIKDYVSCEILVDILDDTGEHIDWLETQLGPIDKVGVQNYLQSQMEPEGK